MAAVVIIVVVLAVVVVVVGLLLRLRLLLPPAIPLLPTTWRPNPIIIVVGIGLQHRESNVNTE